jgi:DNA invertase Pin-like site-specific DNA recombinase
VTKRAGAGRQAAKQRGVKFGRLQKLNKEQQTLALRLLKEGKSVNEVAKTFKW